MQMLSTAAIATGCFPMRFVATLLLVTASFALGHIGKGNWVCAMLGEEKRDGLPLSPPCHKALAGLLPSSVVR